MIISNPHYDRKNITCMVVSHYDKIGFTCEYNLPEYLVSVRWCSKHDESSSSGDDSSSARDINGSENDSSSDDEKQPVRKMVVKNPTSLTQRVKQLKN